MISQKNALKKGKKEDETLFFRLILFSFAAQNKSALSLNSFYIVHSYPVCYADAMYWFLHNCFISTELSQAPEVPWAPVPNSDRKDSRGVPFPTY